MLTIQEDQELVWDVWYDALGQLLICLLSLWLVPDLTQREATDKPMIVTKEWADCGATQDGGIWVAQPFCHRGRENDHG